MVALGLILGFYSFIMLLTCVYVIMNGPVHVVVRPGNAMFTTIVHVLIIVFIMMAI